MPDYFKKVMDNGRAQGLFAEGADITLGLSGGADSVCLLHMLCRLRDILGISVYAVHVHHGIRGSEADRDAEFCRQLCARLKVPFRLEYADVPALAAAGKLTLEEAGRLARYRILGQVCRENGSSLIAVAHHMDDQAETVLMNLLRGSGLPGMAGMRQKRGEIIRPLLCLRKAEILAYLAEEGLDYITDSTNLENDVFRNRLRNCLIPQLESGFQPKAVEHLGDAARIFGEADAWFSERAKALFRSRTKPGSLKEELINRLYGGSVSIPLSLLTGEKPPMDFYLLREAILCLEPSGEGLKNLTGRHLEAILGLDSGKGGMQASLPGNLYAVSEYDSIRLYRGKPRGKDASKDVPSTGTGGTLLKTGDPRALLSCMKLRVSVCEAQPYKKPPQNSCINWLDYAKITGGTQAVVLRTARPGDTICVDGKGSRKSLTRYFIDAKIPKAVRPFYPVAACGKQVIWIPGCRMAQDCIVTENTRLMLVLELRNFSEKSRQDAGGRGSYGRQD